MGDIFSLCLPIIFDDFIEMLCRLMVSDLWIYGIHKLHKSHSQQLMEATGGSTHLDIETMSTGGESIGSGAPLSSPIQGSPSSIVETALANRLQEWLSLI